MTSLRTIRAVTAKAGYQLDVTWANDTHSLVDMSDAITAAGVFAPLANLAAFRSVRVGERARTVEWLVRADAADETIVDIDADALFAMSRPAIAPRAQKASAHG